MSDAMLCTGTGKEKWIEAGVAVRRNVPAWRILDDALEGLSPVMLDSKRHGVRQKLFEGLKGRHPLDPVGVDPIHELLEPQHGDLRSDSRQSFRCHLAREQPPDQRGNENASNDQRDGVEQVHPTHYLNPDHENRDCDRGGDAIAVGGFRIERVDALALER